MKVGLVARMDKTGLGQGQTLRLAKLLKPQKIMLIDSTSFKKLKQYEEWYIDYNRLIVRGFPKPYEIEHFLKDLDIVITCETWYSNVFVDIAKHMGVKTVLIANYEFLDLLNKKYTPPDQMVVPSKWHIQDLAKYNPTYLPTPIFEDEFFSARITNLDRDGGRNYLFINGKTAHEDRNGLQSLYESLKYTDEEFAITIKAQHDVPRIDDSRVFYDVSNPDNPAELYKGYDALILPRRYAGQSLPMCEALQSALPVIMPDISPNNDVLPQKWLVPAKKVRTFMTRAPITLYDTDPKALAHMLETLDTSTKEKLHALEIGQQYNAEVLRPQYIEVLGL